MGELQAAEVQTAGLLLQASEAARLAAEVEAEAEAEAKAKAEAGAEADGEGADCTRCAADGVECGGGETGAVDAAKARRSERLGAKLLRRIDMAELNLSERRQRAAEVTSTVPNPNPNPNPNPDPDPNPNPNPDRNPNPNTNPNPNPTPA